MIGFLPLTMPVLAQEAGVMECPNIVWFLTEDVSTHYLGMFNDGRGAATPNVERLARHGVTYTNAYSCAPVSSAARTTLITGCYAPSFEGAYHRTLSPAAMPENLNMFPAYLRQAGYYTCNAHKTDYNVKVDKTAWDEMKGTLESWQARPDRSKPFFLMRTTMTTHESRVQFPENTINKKKTENSPENVYLHPSLPDTKLMRYTYATFYDRINDSDRELGEIIDMLKKNGELDNTFIFYFGDNGGSLPGTKGYTNDIGIHVPLVVYVPEKWKDKVGYAYGSTEDGLVSFMDFAPTVLSLAGVDVPERMDGQPFLVKEADMEDRVVYGYGDRYDEFYAFNRCIRQGKYRYARNYQPNHPRSLFAYFRYRQAAFREWKDGFEEGKLSAEQQRFFRPMGAEELYDLENDPYELHNLATDPKYKKVVAGLQKQLNRNLKAKADLGFFPETVVLEEALPDADAYGQLHKQEIARFIEIADLQTEKYSKSVEKKLRTALTSENPVERWWGLTTCAYFGKTAQALEHEVNALLQDNRAYVRSKAMVVSSILGQRYDKAQFMAMMEKTQTEAEVLLLLNDLTYLYEEELITPFEIAGGELPYKKFSEDWRLRYLNSYVTTDNWKDRWQMIYKKSK